MYSSYSGLVDNARPRTKTTDSLVFYVNGKKILEQHPNPEETLLNYLRNKLRLTGAKDACSQGGCGSCTVMLSGYNKHTDTIRHWSVVACLTRVVSCHGLAVTTVEGIGSTKTRLHPVQERLAKAHGSQCGFCTPGMVMSMYALLRSNPQPSLQDVEVAIEGNLCRCTGYRTILDGFNTFTKEYCEMGKDCCRNKTHLPGDYKESKLMFEESFASYDPTQELIFPPDLKLHHDAYQGQTLTFRSNDVTWYRPTTLADLLTLKKEFPSAPIIVGGAAISRNKTAVHPVLIHGSHVPELHRIDDLETGVKVGSSVTLSVLETELDSRIKKLEGWKSGVFQSVADILRWYASVQIRNVVALGSTVMTANSTSDLAPILMAAGATIDVTAPGLKTQTIPLDMGFFTDKTSKVKGEDVILSVNIPHSRQNEYFRAYLHGDRRAVSVSRVNAGMRVVLNGETVKDISLCYGGIGDTVILAQGTMAALQGSRWNDNLVSMVTESLGQELDSLMTGRPDDRKYRKTLALGFFYKFYLAVKSTLPSKEEIPRDHLSAILPYSRETTRGGQYYQPVSETQSDIDPIGRPVVHASAFKQAAGEAVYIDDIPKRDGELHLVLVPSDRVHARIVNIDTSAALDMPGVVDVITFKDAPLSNSFGLMDKNDEEFLASKEVLCHGQSVAAILAETREQAVCAIKMVKIEYEDLESILSIQDAIAKDSFFPAHFHEVNHGDTTEAMKTADHVIEGEVTSDAQDHFFLETHRSLVIPGEGDEMEIFCGSQHLQSVQLLAEAVLGTDSHRITARAKRIGGAFGGKETRFALLLGPALIAANKLRRPVRAVLDREEDIQRSGTRHPFLTKYKIGFTKEGKLVAADLQYYMNCGMSVDLSGVVLATALPNSGYFNIPNLHIQSKLCRTNLPSKTAFRGMGSPQVKIVAETYITHVAEFLGRPVEEIREVNLYNEGDVNHYNDKLTPCTLRRCWDDCKLQSDFDNRRKEVDTFNRQNRWKKRGISLVGTKHCLGYNAFFKSYCQASALVLVYTDGSVLLSHGGIELGQGLHTKMIQIASRVLQIPSSKIHINESNTDIIPNAVGTNASTQTDINGGAVIDACERLVERLKPYKETQPEAGWNGWVKAAYMDRVPLSSTGFYKTPGLDYDPVTRTGRFYNYYVFGAACTEVEIDCLTGENKTLRTDIVMDVGSSINPAIDVGQIEGAFMTGLGMVCLERFLVSPDGHVVSNGPLTYKIPTVQNVPVEFNVAILRDSRIDRAVYSSKGVGEAPLSLATSVICAIRDAVKSARADAGYTGYFRFDCPATPDQIRMTCMDEYTK